MCIMLLYHNHENVSYANLICILNVLTILIKRITENKINIQKEKTTTTTKKQKQKQKNKTNRLMKKKEKKKEEYIINKQIEN